METRFTAENLKWLLAGFLLVSLSIFFSYYIFPSQVSILSISFVVIALTPYLYRLMEDEEAVVAHHSKGFLKRYGGILAVMLSLSAGMFLAFAFWYDALPSDPGYGGMCVTSIPCREGVFSLQAGYSCAERSVETLLMIVFISFGLSLFLGAGAILMITWDISTLVVEAAAGPMVFLAYIPQMIAFFLTGLAGALLSFAVVKHEWRSHGFFAVLKDSLILLLISVAIVLAYPYLLPR